MQAADRAEPWGGEQLNIFFFFSSMMTTLLRSSKKNPLNLNLNLNNKTFDSLFFLGRAGPDP